MPPYRKALKWVGIYSYIRSLPDNSYFHVTLWALLFVLTLHAASANIVASSYESVFISGLARAYWPKFRPIAPCRSTFLRNQEPDVARKWLHSDVDRDVSESQVHLPRTSPAVLINDQCTTSVYIWVVSCTFWAASMHPTRDITHVAKAVRV
jgi:hypothetical protein